eukprot:gene60374-biopygen43696
MSDTFTLAACVEMLWRDRPMEWRVKRLTEMGFQVGLWNWPEHDLAMLERSGATFSIMNGYLRGRLADDEGAAELLKTAKETAAVGKRLGVARLNLHGTGLGDGGLPVTPCETSVAAIFQKDPQVFLAHPNPKVTKLEDLKPLTLFVSKEGIAGYFQWMKNEFGFSEAKVKPR